MDVAWGLILPQKLTLNHAHSVASLLLQAMELTRKYWLERRPCIAFTNPQTLQMNNKVSDPSRLRKYKLIQQLLGVDFYSSGKLLA
jgi:hypothetical protein